MVDNLQLVAVVAYLLWCLCASLSDRFEVPEDHRTDIYESDKNAKVGQQYAAPWGHGGRKESDD